MVRRTGNPQQVQRQSLFPRHRQLRPYPGAVLAVPLNYLLETYNLKLIVTCLVTWTLTLNCVYNDRVRIAPSRGLLVSLGIHFISGINEGLAVPLREGQELTVGRKLDNDVVLSHDSWASTRHATVKRQGGLIYIKDLNSTNGTYLAGDRIQANSYQQVKELFVVGSTLFKVAVDATANREGPIAIDNSFKKRYENHELCSAATAMANSSGASIVNVAHIFLSVLILHRERLTPLFPRLKINISDLGGRLEKNKVFRHGHSWLNRFLALTEKLNGQQRYFTPLARDLLAGDRSPEELLRDILCGSFNLVFPLMDWEEAQATWEQVLAPPAATVSDHQPHCQIELPGFLQPLIENQSFWQGLHEVLSKGRIALLTGDPGCGKTVVMQMTFAKQAVADLPDSLTGISNYFDPKIYLSVFTPRKIENYIDRVIGSIRKPGLTVIDHFDVLLRSLKKRKLDMGPLLRAVKSGASPLILVVGQQLIASLSRHFDKAETVDMTPYIESVLPAVHRALIMDFEKQVRVLNKRGKRYFLEKVVADHRTNIRALRDFVDSAIRRGNEIDFNLARTGDETTSMSMMGEAIFKETQEARYVSRVLEEPVLEEPVIEPAPVQREQTVAPPEADIADEMLDQIEELFHTFSKQFFQVSLRYSDRTEKLSEKKRLTREKKLQEMKAHLIHLITVYQTAFPIWFEDFWLKLDPEMIRADLGRKATAKNLWTELEERTHKIDTSYAEDLFHQTGARILRQGLMGKTSKFPSQR